MGTFVDDVSGKVRSGWVLGLFVVIAAGAYGVGSAAVSFLGLYPKDPLTLDDGYLFFTTMVMLAAALGATVVCALLLKAEVGLPRARWARHLLFGIALGGGLVALAVVIPVVAGQGSLSFTTGSFGAVAASAAMQLAILGPTSIGEELLMRGVPLRALVRGTRPWIAVALTGGVFGVMHLMNPGASMVAALNVALVGLWFGALTLRTSLWTAIGAHLAWNWFEGFVFGQPVSGIKPGRSLFEAPVELSGFFSGGDFGPEASGLTTVLLLLATAATVLWPKTLDTPRHFAEEPPQ